MPKGRIFLSLKPNLKLIVLIIAEHSLMYRSRYLGGKVVSTPTNSDHEIYAWPQLNNSIYVNTALSIVTQMIVLISVVSLSLSISLSLSLSLSLSISLSLSQEMSSGLFDLNSLVGVTIIPNSLVGYQLFAILWWGIFRISTFRIWVLNVGSWHIISSVRNNSGHF